jgi:hypothetical protein
MAYLQENRREDMEGIIESLERMRRFEGSPSEFWPAFLEGAVGLARAKFGLLMVRGQNGDSWKNLTVWPSQGIQSVRSPELRTRVEQVADASAERGYAWEDGGLKGSKKKDGVLLGVRLMLEEKDRLSVGVFFVENGTEHSLGEIAIRLKLVADIPAVYQMGRMVRQAKSDVVHFAAALDLLVLLNAEKRYLAAAMTFCNELSSRYRCDRVSLGAWRRPWKRPLIRTRRFCGPGPRETRLW